MNVGLNQFEQTAVKPIDAYSSCLEIFTSFLLRFLGTSFTIHPSTTP